MNNGITYKELYVSFAGVQQIQELEILELPGHHSTLHLTALMDSLLDEKLFYELPEVISINYKENNKENILFKGVLIYSSLMQEGKNKILEMIVEDATHWMNLDRKTRCFQNINISSHDVIREIMKGYNGGVSLINIPNEPTGEIYFQYEETDWEFLNRFLSKYHESLYPSAIYEEIHFQAGLAIKKEKVDWELLPYKKKCDFGKMAYLSANGFQGLLPVQFISYEITNYDVISLGSQVNYKGTPWYIAEVSRKLQNGLLLNCYKLMQKEGMQKEQYFNTRLTGISMDSLIQRVLRDKVQVVIYNNLLTNQGDTYWFPFSTVSSSADGGGWYCMPECGDSVRVYFPTEKESDAYVITNIKGREPEGEGDPMGNPNVRSIQTAQGNLVQFHESGITIEAKNADAKIDLNKDGSVIVTGPQGIHLSASTDFMMSAKIITCKSDGEISIVDDSGADVKVMGSLITLHAQEIFEN